MVLVRFIDSGRLKAIAVTGAKRAPAVTNLPTLAEAGVPGYGATSWNGIFAPAKTPRPVVNKIHAEVVKIPGTPDVREKLWPPGPIRSAATRAVTCLRQIGIGTSGQRYPRKQYPRGVTERFLSVLRLAARPAPCKM